MVKNKGSILIIPLAILLVITTAAAVFFYLQSQKPPSTQQPSKKERADQSLYPATNKYFTTPLPSLAQLRLSDIPNTASVNGIGKYKNKLWLVVDGRVIEFDPSRNEITHVSTDFFGSCFSNLAIIGNHLYFSCFANSDYFSPQTLYKVNLDTLLVEKTFNAANGIQGSSNYTVYPDGTDIWLATFEGITKIDSQDKFTNFGKEIGISASKFDVSRVLIDERSIWAYFPAHAYSQGGIARYDKQTQKWQAFGPSELRDFDKSRFDLTGWSSKFPDKVLVSSYESKGLSGSAPYVCTLKQFAYETNKFTTVQAVSDSDPNACRELAEDTGWKFGLPENWEVENDDFYLTQLVHRGTDGKKTPYLIDGRASLFITPVINNARYILTNATVDKMEIDDPYPKILFKLGQDIAISRSTTDFNSNENNLSFWVDDAVKYALVVNSGCNPMGMMPTCTNPRIWLFDLSFEKLLKLFTKDNSPLPDPESLMGPLSFSKTPQGLQIVNSKGAVLIINPQTLDLTK